MLRVSSAYLIFIAQTTGTFQAAYLGSKMIITGLQKLGSAPHWRNQLLVGTPHTESEIAPTTVRLSGDLLLIYMMNMLPGLPRIERHRTTHRVTPLLGATHNNTQGSRDDNTKVTRCENIWDKIISVMASVSP